MNTKKFVMAPAGTEGAAAGGGTAMTTPPPAPPKEGEGTPPPGNAAAGGTPPAQITLPDNWIETLPDDIKGEASLKQFKDFPSLVKSLVHAQKAIGADKVPIPGKHATESDWKEFYKKTGVVPESLEKYEVKAPDIFKQDEATIGKLKAAAFEANVSPKQFQKMLDVYGENLKEIMLNQQTLAQNEQKKALEGLQVEWGKAYPEKIKQAQAALKKFGGEGLNKILDSTGLGNHPELIKAFAQMGAALKEDGLEGHGSGNSPGVFTPAEAQAKYRTIMGDPSHPYNLAEHPNHKAAVVEVQELFNQAFPTA